MWTGRSDTGRKDGSALDHNEPLSAEEAEKNLERSIKTGLNAPYARVLLRLLLTVLLVSSLGLFVTGMMKYSALQREKAQLEERVEELEVEIEELKYLIDCPVDYEYIVRVAREKLGLHLPDEIVYYNDYNED